MTPTPARVKATVTVVEAAITLVVIEGTEDLEGLRRLRVNECLHGLIADRGVPREVRSGSAMPMCLPRGEAHALSHEDGERDVGDAIVENGVVLVRIMLRVAVTGSLDRHPSIGKHHTPP